jgi:hypothetical protein
MHTETRNAVTLSIYRRRAEAAERAAEAAVDVEVKRMLIAATQRWRKMAGITQLVEDARSAQRSRGFAELCNR